MIVKVIIMEILFILLIALSAYFSSRFIRSNAVPLYLTAFVLSVSSILFFDTTLNPIMTGSLGGSFLIVVMLTGVVNKQSKLYRSLRSVRSEFAILGFILLLPSLYTSLFNTFFNQTPFNYVGLAAILLLTPLFLTSFKIIRTKMATSTWIKLHRYAYLAYFLIYIQLIMSTDFNHIVMYTIIFGGYSVLKLRMFIKRKPLLLSSIITITVGATSILLFSNLLEHFEEPFDILASNEFEDGTYIGYAKGYHNQDTVVRVVIKDNEIELVLVDECGCTPYAKDGMYYDAAFDIASDIKSENRTDIDSIAGATDTSNAITKAVRDALKHALVE